MRAAHRPPRASVLAQAPSPENNRQRDRGDTLHPRQASPRCVCRPRVMERPDGTRALPGLSPAPRGSLHPNQRRSPSSPPGLPPPRRSRSCCSGKTKLRRSSQTSRSASISLVRAQRLTIVIDKSTTSRRAIWKIHTTWALPLRYSFSMLSQIASWLTRVGLGRSNWQIVRLWRHISTPKAERRRPYLFTIICYIHAGACISRVLSAFCALNDRCRIWNPQTWLVSLPPQVRTSRTFLVYPIAGLHSSLSDLILRCR